MADRIDDDLFYDRDVVGVRAVGDDDEPAGDDWYRPDRVRRPPLLWQRARTAGRFGVSTFVIGFVAVFLVQAPFLYQVVLGAPIFEEFVKFGLALMIVNRAPGWVKMPVAWLIGGSFGILEHVTTYSSEPWLVMWWRVTFHGLATGLSMAMFIAVQPAREVRARWLSTAPASAIHYLNNVAAVFLGIGAVVSGEDIVGLQLSVALTSLMAALTVLVLLARRNVRNGLVRLTRRWVARAAPAQPSAHRTPARPR